MPLARNLLTLVDLALHQPCWGCTVGRLMCRLFAAPLHAATANFHPCMHFQAIGIRSYGIIT